MAQLRIRNRKAKDACKTASGAIENDFADVSKIVKTGVAEKEIQDVKLTRYACYLIAQNGDPRKKEIAPYQKPKRWGIGLQAGYGVSIHNGQVLPAPYIGVGVSWDFLQF